MNKDHSFYGKFLDHTKPYVTTLKENMGTVIAVGSTIIAVGALLKSSNSSDSINESLEHQRAMLDIIEEKIAIAIEAPTIVKVEIGDEMELFGLGNRVD